MTPVVDLGPARRPLRLGMVSTVLNTRTVLVVLAAGAGCVVAFVLAVVLGDYPVPISDIPGILAGADGGFATTVVLEWRLPRAIAAVVFGAGLAVSGAIFQSLTRNPLGSPDVIGLGAGAFTGALVAVIWLGGQWMTPLMALAGGIGAAAVVYLLAYRHGMSGLRFVIVGIAVSSALTAVNTILLLRMSTMQATVVNIWGQGTLADLRWAQVIPVGCGIFILLTAAVLLSSRLRQLELGDEPAATTGVRIEPVRIALLTIGVILTAIVTSVCGPIAFVALAAPQLARLLSGAGSTTLLGSAALGALLLSASDVVAAHLLPVSVPVGVVTVVIGGVYLLGLIITEARRP